jgi:hypothetical protein
MHIGVIVPKFVVDGGESEVEKFVKIVLAYFKGVKWQDFILRDFKKVSELDDKSIPEDIVTPNSEWYEREEVQIIHEYEDCYLVRCALFLY